jgi:hypothetical protein
MTVNPDPDRSARLLLAAAALRGTLAGAARAVITWLIEDTCANRQGLTWDSLALLTDLAIPARRARLAAPGRTASGTSTSTSTSSFSQPARALIPHRARAATGPGHRPRCPLPGHRARRWLPS